MKKIATLNWMATVAAIVIASGAAKAADNEVLREGVKEICEEYGGEYWDAGAMFGCKIDDLDADIVCLENSGCVVDETAAGPVHRTAQSQLADYGLVKAVTSPRSYCQTRVVDHRIGKPAEKLQRAACRHYGLTVGSAQR